MINHVPLQSGMAALYTCSANQQMHKTVNFVKTVIFCFATTVEKEKKKKKKLLWFSQPFFFLEVFSILPTQ
jgi:hypothetical protein